VVVVWMCRSKED